MIDEFNRHIGPENSPLICLRLWTPWGIDKTVWRYWALRRKRRRGCHQGRRVRPATI